LDGRIKIFQLTTEGKEVLLWFCSRGELFGFVESGAVPMASVLKLSARACSFSRLLVIKRQAFRQFLLSYPTTALPIIRLLGLRLGEIIEVLSDIISSDVASRVVRLLLRLGRRYGKRVDQGLFLDIALTHQEMADMIGTSRQTVTTVLGELRRQGLIGIEHRSVVIHHSSWLHQEMDWTGLPEDTICPVMKGGYVNSDV
jgi:CRP/FNR family transcriptional regulator